MSAAPSEKPLPRTRVKVEGARRDVLVPAGVGEVTRRMRLRAAIWMITHDAAIVEIARPYGRPLVQVPAEAFLGEKG